MMFSHTGSIPRHRYVFVDSHFTHKEPIGFIPAVWFGLVSFPSRAWGCTVLLESGAIYRNIPLHALATSQTPEPRWTEQDAATWDCYGYHWSTHEYDYLRELRCKVRANGKEHDGEYMFSVSPMLDGFSAYPEQGKEFTFCKLENGRITAQPTNHTVFIERSFTIDPGFPKGLKRQVEIYSSE